VDRPVAVTNLRCRTSDRTPGGGRGAELLARTLDPAARVVGEPPEDPRPTHWRDDLESSRGCIERAGLIVREALDGGRFPVLTASDCSICLTTFPTVAQVRDLRFLWLDAHGDFNSPDTTPSDFLGGMCLGAACGAWDAGYATVDPARVVMHGVRDLDEGERVLVEQAGISFDLDELAGGPVYVHLDLDVLDPSVLPAQFAVPGGLHGAEVREILADLDEIVGIEITAFEAPDDPVEAQRRADWIAGLVRTIL
jgi:arginase